jgi:hypothetical protein
MFKLFDLSRIVDDKVGDEVVDARMYFLCGGWDRLDLVVGET